VFRPISRVRVHAGAGYNLIAPGLRAGATVVAFPFWITPSVSVEAGHYFRGDANGAVRMITGDAEFDEPMLRDVGYSYANGPTAPLNEVATLDGLTVKPLTVLEDSR
jgi:hypothetical protein